MGDTPRSSRGNSVPKDASELEAIEQREWRESLDTYPAGRPRPRAAPPRQPASSRPDVGRVAAVYRGHRVRQLDPPRRRNAPARQPGDRAPHQEHHPLERHGDGGPGQQALDGHRRPHLHLRLGRHALRSRLQPLLPRRGEDGYSGDQIYFQGHASPGHLRARLPRRPAERRATRSTSAASCSRGGGLSSYPHPWLMPDFWEFPTVSMGLGPDHGDLPGPLQPVPEDRGLKDTRDQHVWAFLGDGECDEPESLGAITLAAREKLDNLIFVINCNLQRLDGPVRGNGKIIQELEAAFRGAGWNVIKVIWGNDWDPLSPRTKTACSPSAWARSSTASIRNTPSMPARTSASTSSASIPELLELVEHFSDEKLKKLRRGGHDPEKVYAAYQGRRRAHRAADRHPRQDDQRLRPGRGGRRPQHHAPAEEAERSRSCASSAPALAFRSPTTTWPRRRSIVRRRQCGTAVSANAARRSAASCHREAFASSRCTRLSSRCSRSS